MLSKWSQSKPFAIFVIGFMVIGSIFLLMQIKGIFIIMGAFLKAVVGPFVIAMIISYLLHPIVNALSQRKVPRSIAVLLIYTLFIVSLVIIVMNLLPIVENQLYELVEHLPTWIQQMKQFIEEYHNHSDEVLPYGIRHGIEQSLLKLDETIGQWMYGLMSGLGATINQIFLALIIPFLAFYMLKDVQEIEKEFVKWLPKGKRREVIRLCKNIDEALGNYIRGQFLVCFAVGLLAYLGYLVIQVPYALLLAGLVSIFNIIPYIGPLIGAIPALLVALAISKEMVIGVIVVNGIVQMLEGNVISPQIVGRTLHLHPLVIIFALLVGEYVGGIIGLILAVPIFAVIKVIIEHILSHYIQQREVIGRN